jgi:hypothetical protein
MLTTGGEGRERPDGGELGRPVAVLGGGGAPVVQRSREQAGYARLDLVKHLVLLVCSGINGGGRKSKGAWRRSATVAGGLIRRRRGTLRGRRRNRARAG